MSEKPTVVEALSAVMEDVQAVRKDKRNEQQGYQFRGIDAVVNAVGPAFRRHHIIAVPTKSDARYRDVQTSTGKPSRECTVIVTYRFYGPAGDFIECEVPGESMDFGDKGAPKAMSVAYRIALLQALCIPTDEPDADSQSYERAPQPDPTLAAAQAARFAELTKGLADATTEPDLKAAWEKVVAAYKADEITTTQANQLRADLDKHYLRTPAGAP
jgi:hypothetical protein